MQRNVPSTTTPRSLRAVVALFFCLAAFGCDSGDSAPPALPKKVSPGHSASHDSTSLANEPVADRSIDDGLIDDDGRTLWASPTAGPRIDLAGIVDGSELVLHLRPVLLKATPEGERLWQSLSQLLASDKSTSHANHLVISVAPGETYGVVETTITPDPSSNEELPLLRREIEQLLATSDSDRHATLIVSPGFLLGVGGPLIGGSKAPLRRLLQEYARDDWKAMALSFHVDKEKLYWELRVVGSPDMPELARARQLTKTIEAAPSELETLVEGCPWSDHSKAFLHQTPAMLEVASRYTRRGTEGRQAIVNGYLPAKAAHNVALAAELLVAELSAGTSPKPSQQGPKRTTLAEKLRHPVTLAFSREPMESALRILTNTLSGEHEITFKIIGRDLQLEGITRNQMLSLDVQEKPAEEALVELLRQANPDPLATGPTDPRQKLVYVVREETLVITTRAATQRRDEPLPAVFTD